MLPKKLIFYVFSLLLIIACSNDSFEPMNDKESEENDSPINEVEDSIDEEIEEPFEGPHFTLNVANDFNTSLSDDWIVIHDSTGKLIDAQIFEDGDNLIFESMSPEDITNELIVTLFEFYLFGDENHTYSISTYAEIPRGSTWNLKSVGQFNSDRGEKLANITAKIENLPGDGYFDFNVSTKKGGFGGSAGFVNNVFQANFNLYENDNNYLFSIIDENKNRRFKFIEEFTGNINPVIDYNDFNEFHEKISIESALTNELYSLKIQAFEDNQELGINEGYVLSSLIRESTQRIPPELIYLNGFNEYITSFDIFMEDFDYNFRQVGGKPENITIPETAFLAVDDETVSNFSFSTNTIFNRRKSLWSFRTGQFNSNLVTISWSIESSNSTSVPVTLPEIIRNSYEKLYLEQLDYTNTQLHIGFDTYEEMLEKKFISTSPLYWVGESEESLRFSKE